MSPFDLCAQHAGIVKQPVPLQPGTLMDRSYYIFSCATGDTTFLQEGAVSSFLQPQWNVPMTGAGTDMDPELARLKAVCETLERYASCVLLAGEYRVASARELGAHAFDWTRLPRLSADELAMPRQVFHNFDPEDPIRWIPSWELCADEERWVPVALTHLQPRCWTTERFTFTISTGLAAHTQPVRCIVSAISEAVERDSIALTWLLRRPLRRIVFSDADLRRFAPAQQVFMRNDEFAFYDATTDFGLPIVYLHRRRPFHAVAANLVSCAAAFDYPSAVVNALREMVCLCSGLDSGMVVAKDDPLDCASIEDGAVYMARPERSAAFDFLGASGEEVGLCDLVRIQPPGGDDDARLRLLVERARVLGHEILVSDMTPDDLRDAGLHVFRALMPSLMPMSTDMHCRFLDSERLREAHRVFGMARPLPACINPYPQSFA